MALTRNYLKSMGLTEEQVNAIIENHTDSIDGLKAELATARAAAETVEALTKERDELNDKLSKAGDAAKVQAEFDAYRQQVQTEKANAAKSEAVRKALKASGVQREEFLDLLMGKVELDKVEMDGDAVKDEASFVAPFKASYAGCFASESEQGTKLQNPPSGGGTRMTKEQIAKIENRDERRAAIAANLDLYN